jgi:geranylgeranyl diphosphate synthase type II
MEFASYSRSLRDQIDLALSGYTGPDMGCPEVLRKAMRHSLLAPGKRLRPLLVMIAAEACGYEPIRAIPAACSVEMVHTYSLIHDDLPAMDDDDLRRGQPSCHAEFGEAIAILAGDALLALAFEVLTREIRPLAVAARCVAALSRAAGASALVGGQVEDLEAEFAKGDLAQLESIHRRKTGALFNVSLQLGGLVAEASDEQFTILETYGNKLGLAFQIVDDVLDLQGDEVAMGKRLGKDSERGKLTFPALLGVEESRRKASSLIEQACSALDPLGDRGRGLRTLATFVLERSQ